MLADDAQHRFCAHISSSMTIRMICVGYDSMSFACSVLCGWDAFECQTSRACVLNPGCVEFIDDARNKNARICCGATSITHCVRFFFVCTLYSTQHFWAHLQETSSLLRAPECSGALSRVMLSHRTRSLSYIRLRPLRAVVGLCKGTRIITEPDFAQPVMLSAPDVLQIGFGTTCARTY